MVCTDENVKRFRNVSLSYSVKIARFVAQQQRDFDEKNIPTDITISNEFEPGICIGLENSTDGCE